MTRPNLRFSERNTFEKLARTLLLAAAVFAFVMACLPHPPPLPGEPSDKVQHIAAFVVLGCLAAAGYRRVHLAVLFFALSLFGASIELVQAIPALHRDSDIKDLMADMIAALFALFVTREVLCRFSK